MKKKNNKTDRHYITDILLKKASNTINKTIRISIGSLPSLRVSQNLLMPRYSWNTANVGVKHQSINLSTVVHITRHFNLDSPNKKTLCNRESFICVNMHVIIQYKNGVSNSSSSGSSNTTKVCLILSCKTKQ